MRLRHSGRRGDLSGSAFDPNNYCFYTTWDNIVINSKRRCT